jgi:Reverse transcriptase (RNA-dependent DNA polymerase)
VHIAAAHHAICAQSTQPNSLSSVLRRPDGALWAAAYESDLDRNDILGLWRYEFPRPGDTPRPAIIEFKIKRDANSRELKKKVRIAIRGDLMKPGAEYNPDKTSSQTTFLTALRIFLAAGAAGSLPIEFLDVSGAYPRAYANPSCRQIMRQLPRSDGSLKHPGCVLVMQKAMTGAPNAGYLWKQQCEKDLVKIGWTVLENEPSAYCIINGPHWARLLRNTDDLSLQASSQ